MLNKHRSINGTIINYFRVKVQMLSLKNTGPRAIFPGGSVSFRAVLPGGRIPRFSHPRKQSVKALPRVLTAEWNLLE